MTALETLVDGLDFGEGPRWHDGRLVVLRLLPGWRVRGERRRHPRAHLLGARATVRARLAPRRPHARGLDAATRTCYRLEHGKLELHSSVGHLATHCNDMVVAADGTAYVGHFGFRFYGASDVHRRSSSIVGVRPDGSAWIAATEIEFPNGCVITPDGKTLIVGETAGQRYSAFPIEADGTLRTVTGGCGRRFPALRPTAARSTAEAGSGSPTRRRVRCCASRRAARSRTPSRRRCRTFRVRARRRRRPQLVHHLPPSTSEAKRKGRGDGSIYVTTVDLPHAGLP